MVITSLDNKKVKEWRKLKNRKYREEQGLFLIEGLHLINEALKNNVLEELILIEGEEFSSSVNITYVTDEVMKSLSQLDTSPDIIGVCRKSNTHRELGDKLLIIDGIQDPGNLGTIIRSAVAFEVDSIVLGNNTVDLYNQKCIRASQGMMFYINVIEQDLPSFLPKLKGDGYYILGTDVKGGKNLKDVKNVSKYAVIMGNEGNGISAEVVSMCDDLLHIKTSNSCESLNVAIACSIILYQLNE